MKSADDAVWLRVSTWLGVRTFSVGATIAALVAVAASFTEVVGWLMAARAYSIFEFLRNPRHSLFILPFAFPLVFFVLFLTLLFLFLLRLFTQ